jgi:hypothetical protein
MKRILLFVCTFSLLISCRGQDNQLPRPSGKYLTGVSYLSFIDSSRKELFDNEGKKFRALTIKIWYPTDKQTEPELYLENPETVIVNFGYFFKRKN